MRSTNLHFTYLLTYFVEWHVYKHSSDVRKYVISVTVKNCKVKQVSTSFDVKV